MVYQALFAPVVDSASSAALRKAAAGRDDTSGPDGAPFVRRAIRFDVDFRQEGLQSISH